ncbi:hypothetical protein Tco_0566840 [Tanacetum coccineum]
MNFIHNEMEICLSQHHTAHGRSILTDLKLKEFSRKIHIKLFKNGRACRTEVQVHKMANFTRWQKRFVLVDDSQDAQDHNVKYKFKEQAQSKKSMITTTYSQEKVKSTS